MGVAAKKYMKINLLMESPLALSSGENETSDKDLMHFSDGKPYIPASAIAGVLREKMKEKLDDIKLRDCFGDVIKETSKSNDDNKDSTVAGESELDMENENEKKNHYESKVIFYDAIMREDKDQPCHITVRDSVALDKYKTAKKGAKFDMEVLEADAVFTTYMEETIPDSIKENYSEKLKSSYLEQLTDILLDGICVGGKTTRGYGRIKADVAERAVFNFAESIGKFEEENVNNETNASKTNPSSLDKWLQFDVYLEQNSVLVDGKEYDVWKPYDGNRKKEEETEKKRKILKIRLKQEGGLSIRKYTTEPSKDNEIMPDQEQMKSHFSGEGEKPVIPGTSWAGAFRHRMREFGIDVDGENSIFGYVKGDGADQKKRSKIRFFESKIEGGTEKKISRNAIDRFTGGTVDGALFTEVTHYGGNTILEIEWLGKEAIPPDAKKALAAALTDLHFGFLAVGGETSIGRGLFSITHINDKTLKDDLSNEEEVEKKPFDVICDAVGEVMK